MFRVEKSRIKAWFRVAQNPPFVCPEIIAVPCPDCHLTHAFKLTPQGNNPRTAMLQGLPFNSTCPSCQIPVRFYAIAGNADDTEWRGEVWMHPAPRAHDGVAIEKAEELPPRLVKDYRAVLDCYASGHWRAAASQARTVMEGTVKSLLASEEIPEPQGRPMPLAPLFARLSEKRDLAQPIKDVGTVVREGGNLASHFDADRDIDQDLASEVLDLLDAFIEYLVIIPGQVASLKRMISGESEGGGNKP